MSETYDPHFVRHVTALGDTTEIVTSEPIFARRGIKLVEAGARVDSRLYERLIRHRLEKPLEECVSVAEGVSRASLRVAARALIDDAPLYGALMRRCGDSATAWRIFDVLPLPAPLVLRLTVMRDRRPALLRHSLQCALLALYLGLRERLSESRLAALAAAALAHDIGVLHIDPSLLDASGALSDDDRKHFYAHPLTAYLVLGRYTGFPAEAAEGVLEHHERLDGSGYPRGVHGEELSSFGRILSVVEVVSVLGERASPGGGLLRVETVLKLGRRKHDSRHLDALVDLLRHAREQPPRDAASLDDAVARLERMAALLADWKNAGAAAAARAGGVLDRLVAQRVLAWERAMLEAGFDPSNALSLAGGAEADPATAAEILHLAEEGGWQLREVVLEARRRAAETGAALSPDTERWLGQARAELAREAEPVPAPLQSAS